MTDSVRLGRILGIPVGLHWGALIVAAIFTSSLATTGLADFAPGTGLTVRLIVGVGGVTVFFASILAHELGHALVALRHGVGVSGITLWLMGGVAKLDRQAPSARSEFQIAIAGPAVSFGLGLFFASVGVIVAEIEPNRLAIAVLAWLAGVNIILAVFNLLPAAPLDGGRVLTAILWRRWNDPDQARLVAGRCGLILSVLMVGGGLYLSLFVYGAPGLFNVAVGAMVFFAAGEEIRSAVLSRRLASTSVAAVHANHPQAVSDNVTVAQLREWAGPDGQATAYPVMRWDHEPIGYVVPGELDRLDAPEQSWTKVHQVMHQAPAVTHIPAEASVGALMDLWSAYPATVGVTHGRHDQPVGTVTDQQIRPLLEAPTLWGTDRSHRNTTTVPPPPPAPAIEALEFDGAESIPTHPPMS